MPWITRQAAVDAASQYAGVRIDRLVQEIAGGTRSHVAGLFDFDCVSVNGEVTRETWRRLVAGDRVSVRFEQGRRYHARPRPRAHRGFAIVYEDRELIVVDKSPELLTVPTERNEPYTLVYRVNEYVQRSKKGKGAFPVHRLDRGVSGLLVLGKSKDFADMIRDQFAARKPERKYVAIVAGRMAKTKGEFRSYLATDKSLNRYSTDDEEIGQYAATHYQVLEHFADTTLVEVWLETGRRNQIRVHFSEATQRSTTACRGRHEHGFGRPYGDRWGAVAGPLSSCNGKLARRVLLGHPVLGDPRYRPESAWHRNWPFKRIALHAQTLVLTHPLTDETLRFDSQLPGEMVRFILQARQK